MSAQLHNAISEIQKMPYFKNQHQTSAGAVHGHEDAIAQKFRESDFAEYKTENKLNGDLREWANTGDERKLRKATEDMPNGSFILQPGGTQSFPDILVKDFDGRFIAVEAKSSKNGYCPMWNDSIPKTKINAVYVLSSGKLNKTTVFMGKDVMTSEQEDLFNELESKIDELVKEYMIKAEELDKFGRGFVQKSRRQHWQVGKKDKTNYFTHKSKTQCEQSVMETAKG